VFLLAGCAVVIRLLGPVLRIFGLDIALVKGDRGFSTIKQNAVRRPDGMNPNNYAVPALEPRTALNS
jgi:hypothetical protein